MLHMHPDRITRLQVNLTSNITMGLPTAEGASPLQPNPYYKAQDGSEAEEQKMRSPSPPLGTDSPDDSVFSADVETVHHRYPVEALSDLIIRLRLSDTTQHEFHVHRQNLVQSRYFASLIDMYASQTQDTKNPMLIELPRTFAQIMVLPVSSAWPLDQLQLFIGFLYGQHDDVLLALATAPTTRDFARLLYRQHSLVTYPLTSNEHGGNPWVVVDHTSAGGIRIKAHSGTKHRELVFEPYTWLLRADTLGVDLSPGYQLDILILLGMSLYFESDRLCKLLASILRRLVEVGNIDMVRHIASSVDQLQVEYQQHLIAVRGACIDRLRLAKWQDTDWEWLSRLSSKFLATLLLASAK